MNSKIYLDNNATTKVSESVFNTMLPYLNDTYGNPSSIYSFGSSVKEEIEKSRRNIAKLLNANPSEIIFTSCASESNTTAIMSAVRSNPNKRHIISTSVEHASILETLKYLESIGYSITYIPVDNSGRINVSDIESAIREDTLLITVMMANNEIGNIYPVEEISNLAASHGILFHTDAVQAIGKIKVDVKEINVNTLSFSGHKIHAPKGIGVLYIKEGTPLVPLIFGHQETNRRGGTENAAYIVGLGAAVKDILDDNYTINKTIENLRDYLESEIINRIPNVKIYGDKDNRLSNTSSIAFKGVNPNELMLLLESFNIYVSTGSACNSVLAEPSHVLVACNANLNDYSPIRISLSKYNTKEEIDIFIKRLESVVNILRKKGKN